MNKKVIYTCIVGGYDSLMQPAVVDESFDYICFSNDYSESKIGIWEIRPIPFEHEDKTRLSRYVKILPHIALPEYEYSLWIDGNIRITGREFYDAVNKAIVGDNLMCSLPHPWRECIYLEITTCYLIRKFNLRTSVRIKNYLKESGVPRNYGLYENNVILRKHNDVKIVQIDEQWWAEFNKYSKRDQLSLILVFKRNDFRPNLLLGKGICARNAPYLSYIPHAYNKKPTPKFILPFVYLKEIVQRRFRIQMARLFLIYDKNKCQEL